MKALIALSAVALIGLFASCQQTQSDPVDQPMGDPIVMPAK